MCYKGGFEVIINLQHPREMKNIMKNKGLFLTICCLLVGAFLAAGLYHFEGGTSPSSPSLPRLTGHRQGIQLSQEGSPVIFRDALSELDHQAPLGNATKISFSTPSHLKIINPSSHRALKRLFAQSNYSWKTLNQGVPPLVLESLPPDLDRISQLNKRKKMFFLSLLPMVLLVNGEIHREREDLLSLFNDYDQGGSLAKNRRQQVASLAREYRVKGDPLTDQAARQKLLRRVDIIPPSIVLAQAATESAYGTSRFAQDGNNLFGEWTFIVGTGLVPKKRPAGATYEVRRFDSLYDSVKSYMWNINIHRAYRPFREERAHRRAEDRPLNGIELARGLKRYSIRKEDYVQDIRSIIRQNDLSYLASVSLRNS